LYLVFFVLHVTSDRSVKKFSGWRLMDGAYFVAGITCDHSTPFGSIAILHPCLL